MGKTMRHFYDPFHQSVSPFDLWGRGVQDEHARQAQIKRQRQRDILHQAANQLRRYGFRDERAIFEALRACGNNVKAAAELLLERQRPNTAPGKPQRTSSPDHSSSSSESGSSTEAEAMSEDEMSEDEDPAPPASPTPPANEESGEVEEDEVLRDCRRKTEEIGAEAAKLRVPLLNLVSRECKMHPSGVPLDIVAYEEALLRLQMKLDTISAGDNASEGLRTEVRSLRREAVRSLQERLDQIDVVRKWWLQQPLGHPMAVEGGTPVEVGAA